MGAESPHQALLERVCQRLSATPTTTDALMLLRWRVMSVCKDLLGVPAANRDHIALAALEAFALHGVVGDGADARHVIAALARAASGHTSVIPAIAASTRELVRQRLAVLEDVDHALDRAMHAVQPIRERLRRSSFVGRWAATSL